MSSSSEESVSEEQKVSGAIHIESSKINKGIFQGQTGKLIDQMWGIPFPEPIVALASSELSLEEAKRIATLAAERLENFLANIPIEGSFYSSSESKRDHFTNLYLSFLATRFVISPQVSQYRENR